MSVHVFDNITWKGLCDGHTLHLYNNGTFYQAKSTDLIYNGIDWETICDANYPFGFDISNRSINIIGNFPNPLRFEHVIDFKNDGDNYPWGQIGADFVVRTTITAQPDTPDGDVYIRAYTPADGYTTPVWTFGPVGPGGSYNTTRDFVMSAANYEMRIIAQFNDGDAFQLVTEEIGALEGVDWSGVPFPIDYASTD